MSCFTPIFRSVWVILCNNSPTTQRRRCTMVPQKHRNTVVWKVLCSLSCFDKIFFTLFNHPSCRVIDLRAPLVRLVNFPPYLQNKSKVDRVMMSLLNVRHYYPSISGWEGHSWLICLGIHFHFLFCFVSLGRALLSLSLGLCVSLTL